MIVNIKFVAGVVSIHFSLVSARMSQKRCVHKARVACTVQVQHLAV